MQSGTSKLMVNGRRPVEHTPNTNVAIERDCQHANRGTGEQKDRRKAGDGAGGRWLAQEPEGRRDVPICMMLLGSVAASIRARKFSVCLFVCFEQCAEFTGLVILAWRSRSHPVCH